MRSIQVYIGGEFYLPLFFQSAMEASPLRSGLLILPLLVSEAVIGFVTGIIVDKTGRYREVIWIGLILRTLGNALYINFSATSSITEIVAYELLAGSGVGLLLYPPLIAIQNAVPQEDTATATASLAFVCNLGAAFSIVIGGVFFQNGMGFQIPKLRTAGVPPDVMQALSGGNAAANVMMIGSISDPVQRSAVKHAFSNGMRSIWILYTFISACGLIPSLFITQTALREEHAQTKTGMKE